MKKLALWLMSVCLPFAVINASEIKSTNVQGGNITIDARGSINPFDPGVKVRFIRIDVQKSVNGISYSINDRPMIGEALDNTLRKLSDIDKNQIITVEMGPTTTTDDLIPLIELLKKYEFNNVARRSEDNQPIWILDEDA